MPLYTPKFSNTEFKGGKNILASEHLEFIKGGATLDAKKFPTGYNGVGKLIARNTSTGKYEAVADSADLAGFDSPGILNVDFDNDGQNDLIAGEVIVRGSVYEDKLEDNVSDAFRAASPLIQYIRHI